MSGVLDTLDGLKGWGGWGLCAAAAVAYIKGWPDRRRANNEADVGVRASYGSLITSLSERLDKMQKEHEGDRASWMTERSALRDEYESDRKRWNEELSRERRERVAERDQWRKERSQLIDQVSGLELKLASYGSSVAHMENDGVNAPTVMKRLIMAPVDEKGQVI